MSPRAAARPELPVVLFETPAAWSAWLDAHHAESPGVWVRLAKKGSGLTSITYAEALDGALCYGWIDGLKHKHDDVSWVQKFTPRGRKSVWSKINRGHVDRLTAADRMRPAGLAAVEQARADGRWDAAYDAPGSATVPDDLQAALDRSPAATAFFATVSRVNRYAIIFRVQTAKRPETRARKIAEFVAMLERGEVLYP